MTKRLWGQPRLQIDSYAVAACLLPLFVFWGFCFSFSLSFFQYFNYPFFDLRDFLLPSVVAKIYVQNASWPWEVLHTDRLAYPFGFSFAYFPNPEYLMHWELWILSRFFKNPFLICNLFYLFSFSLCAFSFYHVTRKWIVDRRVSLAFSLLFAFLPFHFTRYFHLYYCNYFLIPWMIHEILIFLAGPEAYRFKFTRKKVLLYLLFGSSGAYFVFFFGMLFSLSALYISIARKNIRLLLEPVKPILLCGLVFGLNLIPFYIYYFTHGFPEPTAQRGYGDALIYSLKPTNLFFPIPEHFFSSFRTIAQWGPLFGIKTDREGWGEGLGLLGSFGLFYCLFSFLRNFKLKKTSLSVFCGLMIFCALLLACTGALGFYISKYLVTFFRSLNRISIFIGFIGLFFTAYFLAKKVAPLSNRRQKIWIISITLLGLFDLIPRNVSISKRSESYRRLVQDYENAFRPWDSTWPKGLRVLQLPTQFFPETHNPYTTPYEYFIPYLVTQNGSFSSPNYFFSQKHLQYVSSRINPRLNFTLLFKEFDAILVDRKAYADGGIRIEKEIHYIVKNYPMLDASKRFAFYKLR